MYIKVITHRGHITTGPPNFQTFLRPCCSSCDSSFGLDLSSHAIPSGSYGTTATLASLGKSSIIFL